MPAPFLPIRPTTMFNMMEESGSRAIIMFLRIFILCLGFLANADRHPRYQCIVSSAQLSFYFCAACFFVTFINVTTFSIDILGVILTRTTGTSLWDMIKDSSMSLVDAVSAVLFLSAAVRLVSTRKHRRFLTISEPLLPSEEPRGSCIEKQ
ncbi:hypothetical protein C8J56DRAFT_140890 [Mycena floridula]|nr:hypothetical protein C8J56DRAFT_140890 [Mycena floridula]